MDGNQEQLRTIMHQAGRAAVIELFAEHPELRQPPPTPQPAWQRWVSGIAAALLTTFLIWLVYTVNSMQVTLARMDERMVSQTSDRDARFADMDRRITRIEGIVGSTEGRGK